MYQKDYNNLFDLGIRSRDDGRVKMKAGNIDAAREEFLKAINIFEEIYLLDFYNGRFNKSLILGSLYSWTETKQEAF